MSVQSNRTVDVFKVVALAASAFCSSSVLAAPATAEPQQLVESAKKTTNVPEPTQLALLAVGGVLAMSRRRRR